MAAVNLPAKVKQLPPVPPFANSEAVRRGLMNKDPQYLLSNLIQFDKGAETIITRGTFAKTEPIYEYIQQEPAATQVLVILGAALQAGNWVLLAQTLDVLTALVKLSSLLKLDHEPLFIATLLSEHAGSLGRAFRSGRNDVLTSLLKLFNVIVGYASGRFAHRVFNSIEWDVKVTSRLFKTRLKDFRGTRDYRRRPDIRTLLVLLVTTLLSLNDTRLKVQILQTRGLLQGLLKGIYEDPQPVINHTLAVLHTIVLDRAIPLDKKLGRNSILDEPSLNEIVKLFVLDTGDVQSPRNTARDFLVSVIDTLASISVSSFYVQRTLGNILKTLNITEDNAQREMALYVLRKAPNEMVGILWNKFPYSLDPRLSSRWISAITFAIEIITVPLETLPSTTSGLIESVVPQTINRTWYIKAIQHDNTLVSFLASIFLLTTLQKAVYVLERIRTNETSAFIEEFRAYLGEVLPDPQTIISTIMNKKTHPLLANVSLRVLFNYHRVLPNTMDSVKFDYFKLPLQFHHQDPISSAYSLRLASLHHQQLFWSRPNEYYKTTLKPLFQLLKATLTDPVTPYSRTLLLEHFVDLLNRPLIVGDENDEEVRPWIDILASCHTAEKLDLFEDSVKKALSSNSKHPTSCPLLNESLKTENEDFIQRIVLSYIGWSRSKEFLLSLIEATGIPESLVDLKKLIEGRKSSKKISINGDIGQATELAVINALITGDDLPANLTDQTQVCGTMIQTLLHCISNNNKEHAVKLIIDIYDLAPQKNDLKEIIFVKNRYATTMKEDDAIGFAINQLAGSILAKEDASLTIDYVSHLKTDDYLKFYTFIQFAPDDDLVKIFHKAFKHPEKNKDAIKRLIQRLSNYGSDSVTFQAIWKNHFVDLVDICSEDAVKVLLLGESLLKDEHKAPKWMKHILKRRNALYSRLLGRMIVCSEACFRYFGTYLDDTELDTALIYPLRAYCEVKSHLGETVLVNGRIVNSLLERSLVTLEAPEEAFKILVLAKETHEQALIDALNTFLNQHGRDSLTPSLLRFVRDLDMSSVETAFLNTAYQYFTRQFVENEVDSQATNDLMIMLTQILVEKDTISGDMAYVDALITAICTRRLDKKLPLILGLALVTLSNLTSSDVSRYLNYIYSHEAIRRREFGDDESEELAMLLMCEVSSKNYATAHTTGVIERALLFYGGTTNRRDTAIYSLFQATEKEKQDYDVALSLRNWIPDGAEEMRNSRLARLQALDRDALHASCLRLIGNTDDRDGLTYDPQFLLQHLFHTLNEETITDWSGLIMSRVLSLPAAGLASSDEAVFRLSQAILQLVLNQLHSENAKFFEKEEMILLLSHCKNTVIYDDEPIPGLIGLFLVCCFELMSLPQHKMYLIIHSFLLQRSLIDLKDVPLFYNLLYSNGDRADLDRQWLIKYLTEGVNRHQDLKILQRRQVIPLISSYIERNVENKETTRALLDKIVSKKFIKYAQYYGAAHMIPSGV